MNFLDFFQAKFKGVASNGMLLCAVVEPAKPVATVAASTAAPTATSTATATASSQAVANAATAAGGDVDDAVVANNNG